MIIAQIDRLRPAEQARLVEIVASRLARMLGAAPASPPVLQTLEALGWPPGFCEATDGALADSPLVIDDPAEIARELDA